MKKFFIFLCCFCIIALSMIPTAFAAPAHELPDFPIDDFYKDYILFSRTYSYGTKYTLVLFDVSADTGLAEYIYMSNSGVLNMGVDDFLFIPNDTYTYLTNSATSSWVITTYDEISHADCYDIHYSTVDILDSSRSEVFFTKTPLPVNLQKMVAAEMKTFLKTTVGTMRTLAVCGIGCLAFLIGLPIFGKVLRRFQVR